MAIIISRQGIQGDICEEAVRLRNLLAAIEGIGAGLSPTEAELEQAPIIDGWVEATRPQPCLAGRIHGHPLLRGRLSITSEVWVAALDYGWIRTFSRFYRLGRHLSDSGRENQ
jgi:hypothetical protein